MSFHKEWDIRCPLHPHGELYSTSSSHILLTHLKSFLASQTLLFLYSPYNDIVSLKLILRWWWWYKMWSVELVRCGPTFGRFFMVHWFSDIDSISIALISAGLLGIHHPTGNQCRWKPIGDILELYYPLHTSLLRMWHNFIQRHMEMHDTERCWHG